MWLNVLRDPTDSSTLPNPKPKDSESNAEKLPHFSASLSSFPPVENEPPTTTPFHMSWMTGTVAIKYAVNLGGWVGRGCVHLYLCKEQTAEKWFFFFFCQENVEAKRFSTQPHWVISARTHFHSARLPCRPCHMVPKAAVSGSRWWFTQQVLSMPATGLAGNHSLAAQGTY